MGMNQQRGVSTILLRQSSLLGLIINFDVQYFWFWNSILYYCAVTYSAWKGPCCTFLAWKGADCACRQKKGYMQGLETFRQDDFCLTRSQTPWEEAFWSRSEKCYFHSFIHCDINVFIRWMTVRIRQPSLKAWTDAEFILMKKSKHNSWFYLSHLKSIPRGRNCRQAYFVQLETMVSGHWSEFL